MVAPWNISALTDFVAHRDGVIARENISESLQSFWKRSEMSLGHAQLFRDLNIEFASICEDYQPNIPPMTLCRGQPEMENWKVA